MQPRKQQKASEVTVTQVRSALRPYMTDPTRITIVNENTIIVWNSNGQKQRMERKRGGSWR
jgi:hypothetical protein